MPFGLRNAPPTFQRLMNIVLTGLQGIRCFVYLDDIVVYGHDLEDHNRKLREVFECLRAHNLKLQPNKCKFLCKEVTYLGHVITDKGIKPDPIKISAIKSISPPKNVKQLKSFLGLVGYYRKFIPRFSKIADPLHKLLRKDIPFNWDAHCDESFNLLKNAVSQPPILQYPNFEKRFYVTTDASNNAIGAVLSQYDSSNQFDLPIAFASRVLNNAEKNYSTIEKEALAVVWATKQFRPYLYGRQFTVVTDHKPLVWIFNLKDPSSRIMRWRIKLEEYDFNVIHKSGHLNTNADALSRLETAEVNVITRSQSAKEAKQITYDAMSNSNITKSKQNPTSISNCSQNPTSDLNQNQASKSNQNPISDPNLHQASKSNYNPISDRNPNRAPKSNHNFTPNPNNDRTSDINQLPFRSSCALNHSTPNLEQNLEPYNKPSISNSTSKHPQEIIHHPLQISKPEDIKRVINEYHNSPIGGHQGISRTYKRIKQHYVWKTMFKDISKYISSCEVCQKSKTGRKTKIPMKITSTSKKPFERISLDIVGPLPTSENGNKYILTFQDDLTKFLQAIPIKDQEASTVAENFVRRIICIFGTPKSLLTDQGTNFLSDVFKRTCKLLKITKIQTTPYHPQSNGSLERCHGNLGNYLRSYSVKDPDNWDNWIDYAVFCYNTTPHTATNYTPYEILFGMKPEIPSSLTKTIDPVYNYDDYVIELKARLQNAYKIAHDNQIKAKEISKAYYDRNTKQIIFNSGDKVLMESKVRKNKKLSSVFEGPYEILEARSPETSLIRLGRKTKLVHNNLLKPFIETQ